MTSSELPIFRYEFDARLTLGRLAAPGAFPPVDPGQNRDRTRELIGFLPWAIVEHSGRLTSAFSYLKAYETHGGTPEDIHNAQQNVIYIMGLMGHFVGDAAQPLHTTIHHHGWVGPNPRGYTTDRAIHQLIDGDFFERTGGIGAEGLKGRVRPAAATGGGPDALFRQTMAFILESHELVEPLYALHKEGGFAGDGPTGLKGRPFLEGRLVRAGQHLGDVWYSAWLNAPEDTYLKDRLMRRQKHSAGQ
jgi:hypothetical protein